MPIQQGELRLPPGQANTEENEQDRESRLWLVTLRRMEDAADEIGRDRICYALCISETTLSRQLREADEKKASGKLLAYLLKHEKSGRLAKWLVADYAGFLPPRKPDVLSPAEAMREVVAMAMAGDVGNAAKERIVDLYQRMKGEKP